MNDPAWRPLGIESDDEVATYDALHDGVPPWLWAPFWTWVRDALTVIRRYPDGSGRVPMLATNLAEAMCQALQIPLPNLRRETANAAAGKHQLETALKVLSSHPSPLQIADYLLAHSDRAKPEDLATLLERGKSAWQVGVRQGRPGLVRRVPAGVQTASDSVMERAGRAGARLAEAWQNLYGVTPNASEAYRLAIVAVEDAAIPVVSPNNARASLGTVLKQIEDQADWHLPMKRQHPEAMSTQVLVGMMRLLWHGHHDRHGGQPTAPGSVTLDEAAVAVSLAVALVQWFHSQLVSRDLGSSER